MVKSVCGQEPPEPSRINEKVCGGEPPGFGLVAVDTRRGALSRL
jgi:hypothetical protein